ncbi:MAG TPA: DUF445 family protein [Gemmatimonadales bacterium]|nr:DUF445 family protein [Gemmatimonadales bacterium]
MDSQTVIAGLVTVGVGALSGGITNAVAVWMLFHPHQPFRLGPIALHGAIPKNKARLARSIGKTVGERLLTAEDLSRRLSDPALRSAFDAAIARGVRALLEAERGSVRETLGPSAMAAVDQALPVLAARLADRAAAWAAGPAFAGQAEQLARRLAAELGDRPVRDALSEAEQARLRSELERWVRGLVEEPELERAVENFVAGELERLAGDERPLVDRLPPGLVPAVEQAAADLLPGLIAGVGAALQDPALRLQVQGIVRDGIRRALRDLVLHQRLLARLVVTDHAIARLLDAFAAEGADRLAAELRGGAMQHRVRQAIADALHGALRVPLGERIRRLDPDRRAALARTIGATLARGLRSEGARQALAHTLDRLVAEANRRTWGEVLGAVPAAGLARLLGEVIASPGGRRWIEDSVQAAARALLDLPVGRLQDWLGPGAPEQISRAVSDAVWGWVMEQVPIVVSHLQVQEMVEQKVLGFSTQRMEEIIRGVTQRELDTIVRLGYFLGGLVGALAWAVHRAFG